MRGKGMVLTFVLLLAGGSASAAVSLPARFDLGTETSPVEEGFVPVTADTIYSLERGYGWVEQGHESLESERPARLAHWFLFKDILFDTYASSLTRDGVRDSNDMTFNVNLPQGRYVVVVTLGDLLQGLGSMSIHANGELVAKNLETKHWASRGGRAAGQWYGFYKRIRFATDVGGGGLKLLFSGDETDYHQWLTDEAAKPSPTSWLVPGRVLKPHPPYRDIGLPFTASSILGIEVYPLSAEPVVMKENELVLDVSGLPPDVDTAVLSLIEKALHAYNLGQPADSENYLDQITVPELDYLRALGYAYLAGNPMYENEEALARKALDLLAQILQINPDDEQALHLRETLRNFSEGIDLIVDRAVSFTDQMKLPSEQRHADTSWEGSYNRVYRGVGKLDLIQPGEPVYYKAKIYEARGLYMVDPHRWVISSGKAADLLREVERKFPQNRFVRLYLHDEWSPGAGWPKFPEYSAATKDAPAWAAAVYEAYNRCLDLCEWWCRNKQFPDGSIGGGWGDDVEALRLFGAYGSICPDASADVMKLCARIVNGALNSPNMDAESGFFGSLADAEHTGEWTGDTIPTMIVLDYGNPRWIELGLKVAKLMRDLWMDQNEKGWYLFRSNMIGAGQVGSGLQANDSRINYRCALPARSVLWYNSNPTIAATYDKWAKTWLEASMSTDKGKPSGLVPAEIGFMKGEIGGTDSPSWYEANHAEGTVNYDWKALEEYHDYIVDLLAGAYRRSKDESFLEPLKLEAELDAEYQRNPIEEPEPGSPQWAGMKLHGVGELWQRLQRTLGLEQGEAPAVTSLESALRRCATSNRGVRQRWPLVTLDSLATDRIYWPDLLAAYSVMTAAGASGMSDVEVTYTGLGRQFAAVVLCSATRELKVALYSFWPSAEDCGLRPWLLDVGAGYKVVAGPDLDADGEPDETVTDETWTLASRGQSYYLRIPPRTPYLVRLKQVSSEGKSILLPDLAITATDIEYNPTRNLITVRIHNVGSAEARSFIVAAYRIPQDGSKSEIGRTVGARLPAPLDLLPQTLRLSIPWEEAASPGKLVIVLDPEDQIREITETNNTVTKDLGSAASGEV